MLSEGNLIRDGLVDAGKQMVSINSLVSTFDIPKILSHNLGVIRKKQFHFGLDDHKLGILAMSHQLLASFITRAELSDWKHQNLRTRRPGEK